MSGTAPRADDAPTVLLPVPPAPGPGVPPGLGDTVVLPVPTGSVPAAQTGSPAEGAMSPPVAASVVPRPSGRLGRLWPASPWRRALRLAGALVLAALVVLGWSLGHAVAKPTSDTLAAKVAEWARDHRLGSVVSFLEQRQYDLNKPRTGGTVAGGAQVGGNAPLLESKPSATKPSATRPTTRPARPPTPLPPPVQPFGTALPGEGQWRSLASVAGQPALLGTALTPDTVHTSYLATVAWMDPQLLRLELRPGFDDPGLRQRWPSRLTGREAGLVAAFNSGFRLYRGGQESQGGFYLDGVEAQPLRQGAASLVIRKDGTATVGQWGRDVGMGPQVLAVRQNLKLLVDNGRPAPTVDENNSPTWGLTLGGTSFVWRSAVGVTKTGALIYVDSPAVNTRTLAEVLARAGAVRGMELDINPQWTHFDYFPRGSDGTVTPTSLNRDQQAPPTRYLEANSSRDFFAVFSREPRAAR